MLFCGLLGTFARSVQADTPHLNPKENELILALRPYLTAGVAVVGAGVIAVSPSVAPPTFVQHLDVRLSATAQNLSPRPVVEQFVHTAAVSEMPSGAVENPLMAGMPASLAGTPAFPNLLGQWAGIVSDAVSNLGLLGQLIAGDPAPILKQLIANQLEYGKLYLTALETVGRNAINLLNPSTPYGFVASLQKVVQQFTAGNIQGAVGTVQTALTMALVQLGLPMLSTLQIPVRMAENFSNVVALLPGFATTMGFGALSLVNTTLASIGESGQAVADAVKARDPLAALGAILSAPGNVVGTFVNGWHGFGGGIIGPNGLLTKLLNFRDTIANALKAGSAASTPAATQTADENRPSAAVSSGAAGLTAESNAGKAAEPDTAISPARGIATTSTLTRGSNTGEAAMTAASNDAPVPTTKTAGVEPASATSPSGTDAPGSSVSSSAASSSGASTKETGESTGTDSTKPAGTLSGASQSGTDHATDGSAKGVENSTGGAKVGKAGSSKAGNAKADDSGAAAPSKPKAVEAGKSGKTAHSKTGSRSSGGHTQPTN